IISCLPSAVGGGVPALSRAACFCVALAGVRLRAGRAGPRTLETALRALPGARLAVVSVPGAYAKLEALAALRRGLHVFLFSDNVPLADEIELKRVAAERRLLCMGPDCGTAYLDGVGLGFANVVPRGRIGCVAASGTGLQAVASGVAALGEGLSHGIGVGGRDLSAAVGGVMTTLALETLRADPATEVILLVSKPPAPELLPRLDEAIRAAGKPVVVCCLGVGPRPGAPGQWVATLEDAARAAVATARGRAWTPCTFDDAAGVRASLDRLTKGADARGGLLGLFTGGTLAHEARLLIEALLGALVDHAPPLPCPSPPRRGRGVTHRILDLGADEFTVGRPHPMLDPTLRDARVREAGASAEVSVLLLDVVLGRVAHPDPARPLADAVREARRRAAAGGRALHAVASVVGTEDDPQRLSDQVGTLRAAGVHVLPSSAQAARFAALLTAPHVAAKVLGAAL
ncbi:MAG: transcriptional regulator, partial [Candidatus Rokuibacteriota bacterium]